MATIPEQLSNMIANSQGKPDANLAQDSNNLGGIPAENWATKEYVKKYHGEKEDLLKKYIDEQDKAKLEEAKEYTNTQIRNQDFSHFAKDTDIHALEEKLEKEIQEGDNAQKAYTDAEIKKLVTDVNANFDDTESAMQALKGRVGTLEKNDETMNGKMEEMKTGMEESNKKINDRIGTLEQNSMTMSGRVETLEENINSINSDIQNLEQGDSNIQTRLSALEQSDSLQTLQISSLDTKYDQLFQSVSNGKSEIAGAITDMGVSTSATDTFGTMASNIREIETGGEIPPGYVDTSNATATASDILFGQTAYAKGNLVVGTHECEGIDTNDATATPYDILSGKTAYVGNRKIEGVLKIDESSGTPSWGTDDVQKIYGTRYHSIEEYEMGTYDSDTYYFRANTISHDYSGSRVVGTYALGMTKDDDVYNRKLVVFSLKDNKFEDINQFSLADLGITTAVAEVVEDEKVSLQDVWLSNLIIEYPYMILHIMSNKSKQAIYIVPFEIEVGSTYNERKLVPQTDKVTRILNASSDDGIQISPNGKYFFTYYSGATDHRDLVVYAYEPAALPIAPRRVTTLKISGNFIKTTWLSYFWANDNMIVFHYCLEGTTPILYAYVVTNSGSIIRTGLGGNNLAITPDGRKILGYDEEKVKDEKYNDYTHNFTYWIKDIEINYDTGEVISSNIKFVPKDMLVSGVVTSNYDTFERPPVGYFISDNLLMIVVNDSYIKDKSQNGTYYYTANLEAETPVFSLFRQTESTDFSSGNSNFGYINENEHELYRTSSNSIIAYSAVKDYSIVVGLKYKGESYYKIGNKTLTARPEDVREGKTFIGLSGGEETGTLPWGTTEETGGEENE